MKPVDFLKTKTFRTVLLTLGAVIVLLIVFQCGMFVGYRKANFAFRWADSYHQHFGGPRGGFLRDFEGSDFVNGHGMMGVIAKIGGNSIIMKGRGPNDAEKIIMVGDATTTIKRGQDTITLKNLKIDDKIVVVGTPHDDGSIEAKIIRLFDSTKERSSMMMPFRMPRFRF